MTSTAGAGDMSAETSLTVTRELTADSLGNPGVLVRLPCVVALLESTSSAVLKPHCRPAADRWAPWWR